MRDMRIDNDKIVIDGSVVLLSEVDGEAKAFYGTSIVPQYSGEYEITPTDTEIVLPVALKQMMQDLVINMIPSNYGKITWDGAVLTVS